MKAGSLINYLGIVGHSEEVLPKVGDGVTFYSWSDRHAGTVFPIVDEAKMIIEVKHDKTTRTDNNGMSDSQTYTYESNPEGHSSYYRFNKKKKTWEEVEKNDNNRWVLAGGNTIRVGFRDAYHDYSF